jgi:hypothetical protein
VKLSLLPEASSLQATDALPGIQTVSGKIVPRKFSLATLAAYFGGGGGGSVWGGITGTLSAQTDLQTALNLKLPYYIATGAWAGYHTVEADHGLTIYNPATGAFSGFFVIGGVGSFYVQNSTGSIWLSMGGALTGTSRFYMGGSHAFEFDHTPYVGTDVMYHAGNLTIGTVAALAVDVDTTLAANSDLRIPSQKAVKTYVDALVVGLLDFKGSQACAANPNYPAALKGDAYYVSSAGKIGGASGKSVDIGDVFIASADNAGGTEASVGTSWFVLEHNLTGALVAANNLSDLANAGTARTNLGLTYFATGTDAANLTGTIAAAQMPAHTGDVTSSAGSVALTIANAAVSLAKIANAAANSKLLGSGASGSGASYAELTLGTNLSMSGTTLNAASTPPGGSDRQIQFNNSGAFAGADHLDIDAQGDLRADYSATPATPGADQISFAPQRIASSSAVMPRWRDETGVFSTVQAHIGRNNMAGLFFIGSTGFTQLGINLTAVGTATTRAPAGTNRLTRTKRTGFVSAATAGAVGGLASQTISNFSLGSGTVVGGGGFRAVFRWAASDAATVAGAHMFVGMFAGTGAPAAATNPNTFTNCVGIAQLNGGANLNVVYGGSAAQTSIDLGANFPAASSSLTNGGLYELILYAPPNSNNTVHYRVERLDTGDIASGTLTGTAGTVLPANTTFLGARAFRSNNATALAVGIDIAGLTIESDF